MDGSPKGKFEMMFKIKKDDIFDSEIRTWYLLGRTAHLKLTLYNYRVSDPELERAVIMTEESHTQTHQSTDLGWGYIVSSNIATDQNIYFSLSIVE